MSLTSDVIGVLIIVFFFLLIYMRAKNKSLRDVITELKGVFKSE